MVDDRPLRVSAATVRASQEHAERIRMELGLGEAESSLAAYWSLAPRHQQWQQIVDRLGLQQLMRARCIEVGSGMGLFTLLGRMLGFDAIGIESSDLRYQSSLQTAASLFADNNLQPMFIQGVAEALPLPDHSVDVVTSFQTLEHVGDVEQSLREIHRILRPGGLLFAQAPNYASFYEAHYGLLAPLGLGKTPLRTYIRRRGKPVAFLDHLQWITPSQLRGRLQAVGFTSVKVKRMSWPNTSTEPLPIQAYPSPFRFRRGTTPARAAQLLAVVFDRLHLDSDRYPQLEIWAIA